jgi:hypothetical protein
VHGRDPRRAYFESLVVAIRVSQLVELKPHVREACPDDDVLAHLALWLAEVSAEAQIVARQDQDEPPDLSAMPE